MIKTFLITISLILLTHACVLSQEATAIPASKMKKADFMTYIDPSDDSLVAMVNLFFRKRKDAGTLAKGVAIALPVMAVLGAATVIGAGTTSNGDPNEAGQAFGVAFAIIFYAAIIPVTVNLIKYSKKKLLQLIDQFQQTATFPDTYLRKLREKDFRSA